METLSVSSVERKKKVCIVGCADSKKEAPYHKSDEFEFWGVNNLYMSQQAPWTRWFEIHQITRDGNIWLRRGKTDFRGMPVNKYIEGLSRLPCPVYMQQHWDEIPNSVQYPFNAMVQNFGTYFTNTISWELALAISEGFEEIHVYGVDMAVDTEYFWQRPSCEYFLGIAVGRGIKVFLPDTCDLLKTRFLYGVQENLELPFRKKIANMLEAMHQRRIKAEQEALFKQRQVYEYNGAIAAVQEVDKIYKNVTGG